MPDEKRGAAQTGGGFKASNVGMFIALEERDMPLVKVQGVSAGAFNVAKLVESGAKALRSHWLEVAHHKPGYIFNRFTALGHIFSTSIFSDSGLNYLLGKLDPKKIIDSPIELEVVVNNETKNQMEVFSSRDEIFKKNPELLLLAIKASASLPGFFPPVRIGSDYYSDGYYFHLERFTDCDTLFVIMNDDPVPHISPTSHWSKRLFAGQYRVLCDKEEDQILEFLRDHSDKFTEFKVSSKLNLAKVKNFLAKLVDKALGERVLSKGVLVVSRPEYSTPSLDLQTFKPGDIEKSIELSTEQARKLLDEIYPPKPPS